MHYLYQTDERALPGNLQNRRFSLSLVCSLAAVVGTSLMNGFLCCFVGQNMRMFPLFMEVTSRIGPFECSVLTAQKTKRISIFPVRLEVSETVIQTQRQCRSVTPLRTPWASSSGPNPCPLELPASGSAAPEPHFLLAV
jgi:hypothetical protein